MTSELDTYTSALLSALGSPNTPTNDAFIKAWINTESPNEVGPGVTSYNPLGVEGTSGQLENFSTMAAGVATTASYIKRLAPQLTGALQSGKATPTQLDAGVYLSDWGGSGAGGGSSATDAKNIGSELGVTLDTSPGSPLAGAHTLAGSGGFLPSNPIPAAANDAKQAASSVANSALGSVVGPLVGDLQRDIYDWAFIAFGLVLVAIGLVVTFKSQAEDVAGAAAPLAAVAE